MSHLYVGIVYCLIYVLDSSFLAEYAFERSFWRVIEIGPESGGAEIEFVPDKQVPKLMY